MPAWIGRGWRASSGCRSSACGLASAAPRPSSIRHRRSDCRLGAHRQLARAAAEGPLVWLRTNALRKQPAASRGVLVAGMPAEALRGISAGVGRVRARGQVLVRMTEKRVSGSLPCCDIFTDILRECDPQECLRSGGGAASRLASITCVQSHLAPGSSRFWETNSGSAKAATVFDARVRNS